MDNTWGQVIGDYLSYLDVAGATRRTRLTRRDHIGLLSRSVPAGSPWVVTPDQLVAYMASRDWSRGSKRAHRSSIRSFYRWAVESGRVAVSPALLLPAVAPSRPRPRPAPDAAVAAALAGADDRVRLMVRLATEVGLRRFEVAQLHSEDLVEDLVGWAVLVRGKGERERLVPLPDDLAATVRAAPAGYLFPSRRGGHLCEEHVGRLVAGLLPAGVTMHSLRHRFATRAYLASNDIFAVQELLGHASADTTRMYVQLDRDRLRRVITAAA